MPVYDYKCENKDCLRYQRRCTLLVKIDERLDQRCEYCGITMDMQLSAPATTFRFADKSGMKRSRS